MNNNTLATVRNFVISLLAPKNRAEGIDGSHWWGKWDPSKATKAIDFAIVKATEGRAWVDMAFKDNMTAAMQIPVRGAYHYQRSLMSWLSQAELFLRVAGQYEMQIYALDVEKIGNEDAYNPKEPGLANIYFSDMRRILDYWRMKAPAGVTVALYTNPDIYQNHIVPAIKRIYGLEGELWLEDQLIWIANYNGQNQDGEPLMPKNRKNPWTFWQYSSNGRKEDYGTQGDVDLNVYNGTREQLFARFLGTSTPPSPPPPVVVPDPEPEPELEQPTPEPTTWTGKVIAFERLIIRSYPDRRPETDTKERIPPGARVAGHLWVGNGYVWMQLSPTPAGESDKWVAVRRHPTGDSFIKLDEQPDAPTIPPPPEEEGDLVDVRVIWDDENPELGNMCRTQTQDQRPKSPPAVYRFYPPQADGSPPKKEKPGDFRVNLEKPHNWRPAMVVLNGGGPAGDHRVRFLTGAARATYNDGDGEKDGWPMQAYIVMSGNTLRGAFVGDWFRFQTLRPTDLVNAQGMSIHNHAHLVQSFHCVGWDNRRKKTKRIESSNTRRGKVYYFLVTNEGVAYIPARHVKVIG